MVKNEREFLESKKNKHFESLYLKFPGKRVEDVSGVSGPYFVRSDAEKASKVLKESKGKEGRFTHDHPTYRFLPTLGGPIPSSIDFKILLTNSALRTMVVAQNDPLSGKVEGYFVARKTKKTPRDRILWNRLMPTLLELPIFFGASGRPYLNYFAEQYGLKYRFVPSEGYTLNERGTRFVPVHKKSLEHKTQRALAAFVAASFLFSLLFSLFSITGRAVSDLNQSTSNLFGAIFFIIGIIGVLVYFKVR